MYTILRILAGDVLHIDIAHSRVVATTANLIVRSGSYNANANDATDYDKMAVAIATIQSEGVKISNPDINNPQFEFVPNVQDEKIEFSMKGINGVNTELAQAIIQNAPYTSILAPGSETQEQTRIYH